MSKKKSMGRGGMGGGGFGGFGGGGGGFNPGNLMAQVQKIQEEMAAAQDSLKEEIVEASVGGGFVTVRMTGAQELVAIEIKPEVVDPDDVETLQDLLMAAFNEASQKARDLAEQKMAPFANMLNMGGLGGLLG
ncbi:MAG TPA: YbaB/EbfC family nucleoid-associated protein [Ardenticatenaceae bacterium]|nr:YbaB/EbfC family nucleoid-associated protein [Ardenticatenaceae bacterium]